MTNGEKTAWGIMFCLSIFFAGAILGNIASEKGWNEDCSKMGSHRHGAKVYDCKVRGT